MEIDMFTKEWDEVLPMVEDWLRSKEMVAQFEPGQEVEWLTRPDGNRGYLHGIVIKVGMHKVEIEVKSPKTGEVKRKWAEPRNLRRLT